MSFSKEKINKEVVFFIIIFFIAIISLFFLPLFRGKSLWGPDNLAYGSVLQQSQLPYSVTGRWSEIMCGSATTPYWVVPGSMLLFFLPPLLAHVLAYVFDVLLLICAMLFLLRGFKIKGAPLYLGALAMGLSFHSFTIIAAGHLGKFHMMPMAVFMLAFLDRAIKERSLFYFALLGVAAAFGFAAQADVMFVFILLGAAYGLYNFIMEWPKKGYLKYILKIVFGVIVAAVMFFGVSAVSLKSLTSHTLGARAEMSGDTPAQKWEFATNWSLPPEDIVEFVAPCLRGVESVDATPYWGRLGQTKGWMQHHQGLRNLRQHTVYLGVLQVVFAFFAIWLVVIYGKSSKENADGEEPLVSKRRRADVYFWSGVFVVAILMSLGRYFPLYRLFYMFPYASSMRAPVKFMHVVEVSLTVLFAFGLDGLFKMATDADSLKKKDLFVGKKISGLILFVIAIAVVGGLLLMGAMYVSGNPTGLVEHLKLMGFANYSKVLISNMSNAYLHGALLFFFCAGIIWCANKFSGRKWLIVWLPIVLMLVLAMDLISVDRKYVKTKDLSMFFDSNVLIKKLQADNELYRLSCPMNNPPFTQWKTFMFTRHLIDGLEPTGQMPELYRPYFIALQSNIVRLWQLTNSRYILGPTQWTDKLLKNKAFKQVLSFNMDRRGGIIPADFRGGQISLVEFAGALPRALVYHSWQVVPADSAIEKLTDKSWNPAKSLLISGDDVKSKDGGAPEAVKSIVHKPQKVMIKVDLAKEGVLLLNDRYDPDWKVFVDGKEGEVFQCNAIMRGVKVPAGKHKVIFVYHPYLKQFVISMLALLIVAMWGVIRRFGR